VTVIWSGVVLQEWESEYHWPSLGSHNLRVHGIAVAGHSRSGSVPGDDRSECRVWQHRILIGAHYAMDVLGGRALSTYDMAHLLANDPVYTGRSLPGPSSRIIRRL
jgi:hypothetical protein